MRLNQKLTTIISGHTIQSVSQKDNLGQLTFTDGSVLTVDLAAPMPDKVTRRGRVKLVRQDGTVMIFEFTDDSSLEITLAEAASSVLLRNAEGKLVYAE
jgi:hypothetical protein